MSSSLMMWLLAVLPALCIASREEALDFISSPVTGSDGAAFVQHRHDMQRSHHHAGGGGGYHMAKCQGESLRKSCLMSQPDYFQHLRVAAESERVHPRFNDGAAILKELEASNPDIWTKYPKARSAFEALRHLDARQVLAFKETWTDGDSDLLRKIGVQNDGFTEGRFTDGKFMSYLPSIKLLEDLLAEGPMAVVGSGPTVKGRGGEIDNHPSVVRFNSHTGKELSPRNTGTKMTVHVMNSMVDFPEEKDVLHFDLESTNPGSSMCKRWHQPSAHTAPVKDKVTIMMRPSAFCGLPDEIAGFTRGFLFYWLVGRLANHTSMFGMSNRDGLSHYKETGELIQEPFLPFEHELYAAAATVQGRMIAEEHKRKAEAEMALQQRLKAEAEATTAAAVDSPATTAAAEAASTVAAEGKATTVAAAAAEATSTATAAAGAITTAAPVAAATTGAEAAAATTGASGKAATTSAAAAPGTTAAGAATAAAATNAATEAAPAGATTAAPEAGATTAAGAGAAATTSPAAEKEEGESASNTTMAPVAAESAAPNAPAEPHHHMEKSASPAAATFSVTAAALLMALQLFVAQ
mmetsp:Transcript_51970/g.123721  ORF Transcript_51970/g.123721 Transcript_51970/m.123721 type:complete len:581 (+) Transcript_51970:74-1816(+)